MRLNNFIVIFLLFIKTLELENNIILNCSYLTINDNFTYMRRQEYNDKKDTFGIYLGNELYYINFNKTDNFIINEDSIEIKYYDKDNNCNYSFIYKNNDSKVYHCHDDDFLFINEENQTYFTIKNDEDLKFKIKDKNETITIKGSSKTVKVLSADNEYNLINNYSFSFLLLFFGCLIILYGSYHYRFGAIIHLFFLLYFFFGDFISFFFVFRLYTMFFLLGCFLISTTFNLFLHVNKPHDKNENDVLSFIMGEKNSSGEERGSSEVMGFKTRMLITNIIYGINFGFCLFKTFIYYYIYFQGPISFIPNNWRLAIYMTVLILVMAFGLFTTLFLHGAYKKYEYAYLPCSAICGSFYIVKSIEYIIGGYYSSILFFIEDLKFYNLGDERLQISLTYFLIHLFLIIFSIIFQIKYIEFKKSESPFIDLSLLTANLPQRVSELSNPNTQSDKNDDEALLEDRKEENSLNDDEEINDQED